MVAQPAAPNEGPLGQRVEASIGDEGGQPAAPNKPGSVAALLYDPGDCKTAKYCNNSALAYMEAVAASGLRVPLTPQPVVNWLYQVLAIALQTMQGFLGAEGRFNASGVVVSDALDTAESRAVGGQCFVFWGTEIGARRDQSMISWDYDADIAVFVTGTNVFPTVWEKTSKVLEPLGVRLIEHAPGFKYRIAPSKPLSFHAWREFLHEARLENPGKSRQGLMYVAREKRQSQSMPSNPCGANCVDIEVYVVQPAADVKIRGTKTILVRNN